MRSPPVRFDPASNSKLSGGLRDESMIKLDGGSRTMKATAGAVLALLTGGSRKVLLGTFSVRAPSPGNMPADMVFSGQGNEQGCEHNGKWYGEASVVPKD